MYMQSEQPRLKTDGKYAYKRVLDELIDYRGDMRGNTSSFHSDYSPNNIKRLILSPDMAEVDYFIAIDGRKSKLVRLPLYKDCAMNMDYISMLSALYKGRVCGSIEEIVLIVNSEDGSITLRQEELDFSFLNNVRGTYSGNGDLKSAVERKYTRLHDFTIVQGMTFRQFNEARKQCFNNEKVKYLCDYSFMKSKSQITYFHDKEEDYVFEEHYQSYAKYYDFDKADGALNIYFKKVKDEALKSIKDAKIADFNKERNKVKDELKIRLVKTYNIYRNIAKCFSKLNKTDFNILYRGTSNISLNLVSLYKCDSITDYPKVIEDNKLSTNEVYKQNISILDKAVYDAYICSAKYLIDILITLKSLSPVAYKAVLKESGIEFNSGVGATLEVNTSSSKKVLSLLADNLALIAQVALVKVPEFRKSEYWQKQVNKEG